ncbi:hypothetical protein M3Y98_00674800 [Aphelenchoides besseyi]|nr:hypothetical protein M3Y98_00674800 [Aphelenchoides besseyi]
MLWVLISVGAALLSYLWFFRNEVKPETVKKEVDKIADKVVRKAEEAKEKVEEKIEKEESLKLDKTASERSTHTALEKTAKKNVEPRPTQVVTACLGSENKTPAQVQSANVSVSEPPKDVATAREQLASEPQLGSVLPTATQQNNEIVLNALNGDAVPQLTNPMLASASGPAEVKKEETKPKDEFVRPDVIQKPDQSMQVDFTQKPLDPVVENRARAIVEKKKKHKKHKHKKNSNREGGEKKKSKKKKSKRSKKNADAANEQPDA